MTTFEDYQQEVDARRYYPGRDSIPGLTYAVLALAGEAGELANQMKKVIRDDASILSVERRAAMLDELGDVFWYAFAVALELGEDAVAVMAGNIRKLEARRPR